jgi:hypothetical protein
MLPQMAITHLFSYLVLPGKHAEIEEEPTGAQLPLSGSLFEMLAEVFVASDVECTIPIRFRMADDGSQQNAARDEVIGLLRSPSLATALALARRLYRATTERSGLGLLFFMFGNENSDIKFVVSRFPADQGVLAEAHSETLEVEFVERVFMKNAASYKAALYRGRSYDEDFWDGTVVDKQITYGHESAAIYWLKEFLLSDFRTTGPAGSRRLAIALRDAVRSAPDLELKQELLAATSLVPGLDGHAISAAGLCETFNLSTAARNTIAQHLPEQRLREAVFALDAVEFKRYAAFRALELDNEGILMAPAAAFDEVFKREVADRSRGTERFSVVGRVVNESLRGKR